MESLKHWRYVCHETKSSYQKNMLIAMGGVYVLLLVTVTAFVFWPRHDKATSPAPSESTVKPIQPASVTDIPAAAAKGSRVSNSGGLASILKTLGHNSGQIKIIREPAVTPEINKTRRITGPVTLDDFCQIVIYDDLDYNGDDRVPGSGGAGGSDLFGLGDNTFGLPGGLYCPPLTGSLDSSQAHPGGPANVPVFMGLPIPPFPSTARPDDTGIVVVDLTVSKKGYVSYDILSIEPYGFGFGNAAEWAIKRGKYSPRVVDGLPVEHTIRLTLIMARNRDPSTGESTAEFTFSSPDVVPVWLDEK